MYVMVNDAHQIHATKYIFVCTPTEKRVENEEKRNVIKSYMSTMAQKTTEKELKLRDVAK